MKPLNPSGSRIHRIRDQKVMLDRDAASLYHVENRALKQAVRKHIDRFPLDFMFELTAEEAAAVRIKPDLSNKGRRSPEATLAFTGLGLVVLSGILNSDHAVQVNTLIVRAYAMFRKLLSAHDVLEKKIEETENRYDPNTENVFDAVKALLEIDSGPAKRKSPPKGRQTGLIKLGPADDFDLTPQARRKWDAIAGDIQIKILNNVWCVGCRDTTGIGNVSGKVERGTLVLKGVCTRCGGDVARVIEND